MCCSMIMILSIDYEKKNKSDKIDNTWEASESKIKENVKSKWYIYLKKVPKNKHFLFSYSRRQ